MSNPTETDVPETVRGEDAERKFVPAHLAFAWDGGGLRVVSDDVLDLLAKPYLSPSTANSMEGCPARWAGEKVLDGPEDPFSATAIGTSAHAVLERFYALPGRQRTVDAAMEILIADSLEQWPGEENEEVRSKWLRAVHEAYQGLFKIEDPTKVVVSAVEQKVIGIEIAGVPFKAYIDRTDLTPDGSEVVDYKSGRIPDLRYGDSQGDQIRLYSEAIRVLTGSMPVKGRLHYTRHGKTRSVSLSKAKMENVLTRFQKSWKDLNDYTETRTFPTVTSTLCGWCPLVNSCPTGQSEGKTDRKGGALSAVDLGIPVLRPLPEVAKPDADLDFGSGLDDPFADIGPEPVLPPDPEDSGFVVPEAVVNSEPAGSEQPESVHVNGSVTPSPSTRPREKNDMSDLLAEGKPWEETVNGSLNTASYAATAVFGNASLAYEELMKAGQRPTKATIDGLAATFGHIVNEAQLRLTGVSSWQDASNTRLRGALRTYMTVNPLPFGQSAEAWKDWVETGVKHVSSIASAAVRLYEADLSGTPWTALAAESVDA